MSQLTHTHDFLKNAYDLHLHCSPDTVSRCISGYEAAVQAKHRSMAGIGIKDHCTDTEPAAAAIREALGGDFVVVSWLVLNPPVGGMNPTAVKAALQKGTNIICFPTYAAANAINRSNSLVTRKYPFPECFDGYRIIDDNGQILEEIHEILKLIASYNAVLATGHISAEESIQLIETAQRMGVRKILVNHVSSNVINMPITLQKRAADMGAMIEHSALSVCPQEKKRISLEDVALAINEVGTDHVILTSDYGRVGIDLPIVGFEDFLRRLYDYGIDAKDIQKMVGDNPKNLFALS